MLKKVWLISTVVLVFCLVVNMWPFESNLDPMSNGENFVNRAMITLATVSLGMLSIGVWLVCFVCAIFSHTKRLFKSCSKAENPPEEK